MTKIDAIDNAIKALQDFITYESAAISPQTNRVIERGRGAIQDLTAYKDDLLEEQQHLLESLEALMMLNEYGYTINGWELYNEAVQDVIELIYGDSDE